MTDNGSYSINTLADMEVPIDTIKSLTVVAMELHEHNDPIRRRGVEAILRSICMICDRLDHVRDQVPGYFTPFQVDPMRVSKQPMTANEVRTLSVSLPERDGNDQRQRRPLTWV